jgi:hypothetical protein
VFKYKTPLANLEILYGETSKVVEPLYESSDQNCLPSMSVAMSLTGASNYVAYDPAATDALDYISAVADRSLTLASAIAG